MSFQIDTTGVVLGPFNETGYLDWNDLTPFAQGYVEALFQSLPVRRCGWCGVPVKAAARKDGFGCGRHAQCTEAVRDERARLYAKGFADLAPETLARIIADCACRSARLLAVYRDKRGGHEFWEARQIGAAPADFPPLTVQLGEDGKVRFAP